MKMDHLISSEEAKDLVASVIQQLGVEQIPFTKAKGRVLAEAIFTDRPYPPFDRATMDGIAIRFKDLKNLRSGISCKKTAFAGEPQRLLAPQEAIKIMTGAPVPEDAELVIQVEKLKFEDEKVFCEDVSDMKVGQHIHPIGSDLSVDELVLKSGKTLSSGDVACLATLGKTAVLVKRNPVIGIITTGDELILPSESPLEHQIRSSNRYFLESVFKSRGAQVQSFHVPDEIEMIKKEIDKMIKRVDFLILCGGVSKGDKDHVYKALDALEASKLFHRVAQKPGKPLWFGTLNQKPVFGLPGNPLSVAATCCAYILPQLFSIPPEFLELSVDTLFKPALTYYCPGICFRDGDLVRFKPTKFNTSGDVLSLSKISGFLELPASKDEFKQGEKYRYYPID